MVNGKRKEGAGSGFLQEKKLFAARKEEKTTHSPFVIVVILVEVEGKVVVPLFERYC